MRVIVKIDHVYQSQEVAKQIKYYIVGEFYCT